MQYPYIENYRKNEDYPDTASSSPLSSDSEQGDTNNNSNPINSKNKRRINYLRMLKYQENFMLAGKYFSNKSIIITIITGSHG